MNNCFNNKNIEIISDIIKNKDDTNNWVNLSIETAKSIVKTFLQDVDRSLLPFPKLPKGYKLNFIEKYLNFLKNKENEQELESLIFELAMTMQHHGIFKKSMPNSPLFPLRLELTHRTCLKTGDFISVFINEDFSFSFKTFKNNQLVDLESNGFDNKIYESSFNIITGKMIAADWFRTTNDEFNTIIRKNYNISSINNESGRIESTMFFADKKMIHVHVGNSSPIININNDNIYIGQPKQSKENDKMIITDLWGVSMIEECNFIDHLMYFGLSKKSALNELSTLKQSNEVLSFNITKGQYVLKYSANVEEFQKLYKKQYKNNNLPKNFKSFFTFEKTN